MHRAFILRIAALAAFGLAGSAVAQDAAQTGQSPGAGNAGDVEALTCADLTEMEAAEANAFLRGYQYAQTAGDRSAATSETTTTETGTAEAEAAPADGGAGVGVATGTGNPAGDDAGGGATDVGLQAIIDSCFDAPATSLDEALSGAFSAAN